MQAQSVRIDGVSVATAMRTDGQDRSLRIWQQCRRLVNDELFLLSMTNPASFDSRYFGPIFARDVIGNAQPIWTWDTP